MSIDKETVYKIAKLSRIKIDEKENYGQDYCPKSANIYKSKVANSQEAHEAIRPTKINILPQKIKQYLNDDEYKLMI